MDGPNQVQPTVEKDAAHFTTRPQDRTVLRSRSRIVVVDLLHHIPVDADTFTIESRFARELATDEQPYMRLNQAATETWSAIDLGWVKEPGMVLIVNEEGRRPQSNPTQEQRDELSKKVLEVILIENTGSWARPWLVYPGESMRGVPDGNLFVRSRSGKIKYTVVALPR